MGKKDKCAVSGCNNTRGSKVNIILPHISRFDGSNELKFWTCRDPSNFSKWTHLLNYTNYNVNGNTKICSNHFKFGRPTAIDPHPSLYLKGYNTETATKRKSPLKRTTLNNNFTAKKSYSNNKTKYATHLIDRNKENHNNEQKSPQLGVKSTHDFSCQADNEICESCLSLKMEIEHLKEQVAALQSKINLTFDSIKQSNELVNFYTGCPSTEIFNFIIDKIKPHYPKLQYYRGQSSHEPKKYQHSPTVEGCQMKPGPKRKLSLENEVFMTLMRIRLDLKIEDLAFRFGLSKSYTSSILSTMYTFLARELEPIIYWPSKQQTLSYNSTQFKGELSKVEGIIDCTEQKISKPSLTKAQYQTYSTYKSSNTLKKLIICTKAGSISYISPSFGGLASDRFISEQCLVAKKFSPGMVALVDRGFNVQDLFLPYQVKLMMPPFKGKHEQFSKEQVTQAKEIASARIHIERAIGRLKEFDLLKNELPINLLDVTDDIWTIAGAISNLQPPLIKD